MSVSNGQLANAATFNGAFVSKSSDSTVSATLTQDKESVLKEIATPATPASGYGKIYFKADGKLYQLNDVGIETQVGTGTGGGAGGVNFITNGAAEDNNTTGWAVYADAAGTSPVDGTGGTANVTNTVTAVTPLAGTYSFLLAKDAVNRQGQGWSYDFTVAPAYRAKVLQISFDYLVNSGTFTAGTPSADSDVTVWIYDVTNSQLIQPSSYKLLSNSASIVDKFNATFQSSSTGSSYRIIFHVATTSASAYTLEVDNVSVSPSTYVYGTPVTDWQSYTPTTAGLGTISAVAMYWRRVGASVEIMGNLTTGTVAASEAQIGLPSGLTSTSTISTIQLAGTVVLGTTTSSYRNLLIETSKTYLTVGVAAATSQLTKQNGSTFANTIVLSFQASVPIQGWSSSVQTSDQTDTRVVAANYSMNGSTSSTSVTTSDARIDFNSRNIDTHGSTTTGASWSYLVPVSGVYKYTITTRATASAIGSLFVTPYVNGSAITNNLGVLYNAAATGIGGVFSGLLNLNAGNTLDFRASVSVGTATHSTAGYTNLSLERVSGPSAIAASETVAARYYSSSTAVSGTFANITYATKDYDTHGSYSGGIFTVPISGKYQVNAGLSFTFASSSNPESRIAIFKNATQITEQLSFMGAASQSSTPSNITCDIVNCIAGDQIIIKGSCTATTPVIRTSNFYNYVSIVRVGN
jgi:hypothetical protein